MCGYVALLGSCAPDELARMAGAVAHRGPDGEGEYHDAHFSAIHHRLAIVGADARGRQPMLREDVVAVFNGCIYNYPELRKQLEQDGVAFTSDADTEVLPHLYRRFGVGMFSLLNGMFSTVLWDRRDETLIAARDPFGEKPLFVCEQGGRVGFASLLSAFEHGDWRLTPDIQAVHEVLTRMRIETPRTMYEQVWQLPAGSYVLATQGSLQQPRRFFFLPEAEQSNALAPNEIEGALGELLDTAFVQRTLADKPLGVFLSGGVDSSLVAESLARQLPQPVHTFSVRFADAPPGYDESAYAGLVAKHIGSLHEVLEVRAEANAALADVAAAFDQPVANSTALPTYLICKAAKQHVDVALSGVGGDELFGGYPRYLGMHWLARMRGLPLGGLLHRFMACMGEGGGSRNLRGRLRRFVAAFGIPPDEAYVQWISSLQAPWQEVFTLPPQAAKPLLWAPTTAAYGGLAGLLQRYGPVNGAMAYDVLTYLPDDLLAMGDRMSMAHALELRSPFLDTRLLTLMMSLDASSKVGGPPWREGLKLLLRRIARKRLPTDVVDRPKQGFMAPVKHWLRGSLASTIDELCCGRPLAGLVKREFIRQQWAMHQAGRDRSDTLWALLLLHRWMHLHGWDFS